MWFMHLARKISILFMLLAVCGYSKKLHIFNPWDDVHVKIISSIGTSHMTNVDLNDCGWYIFEYYDDELEVKITSSNGEEYGSNGANGGSFISLLGKNEDVWLTFSGTSHTFSDSDPNNNKGCLGILQGEVFDWAAGDFLTTGYAAAFEGGGSCAGGTDDLVQSTLNAAGLPVPVVDAQAKCRAGSVTQWFQNDPGFDNSVCVDLPLFDNNSNGVYEIDRTIGSGYDGFFPVDDFTEISQGVPNPKNSMNTYSPNHNFHFCMKTHTTFTYQLNQTFTFTGDDDVWVFIDGTLRLDLGGVHGEKTSTITLNNIFTGSDVDTQHDFDLFYCERQTTGSNLQIQTNIDFEQNTVYWNNKLDDTTYTVIQGTESSQGCGATNQVIVAESDFFISTSPSITDTIANLNLTAGSSTFGGGLRIDPDQKRFYVVPDRISKNPTQSGINLPPGKYYLIHKTTSPLRTDIGYVKFFVYPAISFNMNGVSSQLEDLDSGIVRLDFSLSTASTQDITFDYSIIGGTATANDYTNFSNSNYVISAGATSGYVEFRVTPDILAEADETVIVQMSNPSNVIFGTAKEATHTILNDDFAPEVKNSIPDTTMLEDADPITIPIMNVFDKKGNVVTYSVEILDTTNRSINVVISGATGNESVTISTIKDLNGTNEVEITALAANGLSATETFNVVVTPVNDLPTIRPKEAVQTIRLIVSADKKDSVPLQRIWVEDIETAAASLTVTVVSSADEIALPVDSIWILNVAGENNMRDIKIKPVQNSADTFNVVLQVDDGTDVVEMIMVVEITGQFRIVKYIGDDHNEDENFIISNTDLSYINIASGFTITDIVLGFPTPDASANYTLKGDSIVPNKDFNGFLTVTVEATVNGTTTQGDVDIKLLNTNDAPYDVGLVDNDFNENVSVCQELTAKDDDGDDVTFEVIDDVRFEVKNGNQLCSIDGALDYEAFTIGTVRVIATDGIDTVTTEISFDVVDEIEYSTGQIESITDITIQKYMNVAQDSALVLTNQSSITVEYSVEGVDGTTIQEIILGPGGLNGINTYEIYAQNPTKNNPDTLKITVVHNSIGPTVIVTDDDIMLQAVDGDTLNRLVHSITKEIQGTAFFDGSTIDTVYTFNKRLVLDKYIALLDENLNQSTIVSYVSLDEYTLIQGTVNTITDSIVDVFGNVTTYTFYVVYDTIPPTVTIVNPVDSIKTSLSLIEVVWTVTDDAEFIEKIGSEDLTIGDWPIVRDYMDLAGNVGTDSIIIRVILAEIGGDLTLKEDLITVTPNERGNVYGDEEYVSGVYIVKQAKDVGEEVTYNAVFGDHVAGEQKLTNGMSDGEFDADEMKDRLTYDKKRGPEVVVTMNLKPIYPFDSDNRPMTFLPAQWSNHVTGEVVMYDMVGQYLSTYKFDVPVDDPEYFTEDGEVILRFKIFMRGDGENIVLRTRGDRQLGSGVYLLMARFIGTSIPLITESGLKPEKFVTNKVMRFGYSRPESGLVITPVD